MERSDLRTRRLTIQEEIQELQADWMTLYIQSREFIMISMLEKL